MIFAINWLALLLLSFTGNDHNRADTVGALLRSEKVVAAVHSGNRPGLEKAIAEALFPDGIWKEPSVAHALSGLIPGFSALLIADSLLATADSLLRQEKAEDLVVRGVFRKLGVSGEVAPALLKYTLRPEHQAEEAVRAERDEIRSRLERDLVRLKRRASAADR